MKRRKIDGQPLKNAQDKSKLRSKNQERECSKDELKREPCPWLWGLLLLAVLSNPPLFMILILLLGKKSWNFSGLITLKTMFCKFAVLIRSLLSCHCVSTVGRLLDYFESSLLRQPMRRLESSELPMSAITMGNNH